MASSSTNPSTAALVDGTLVVAAGVGIVTLACFPPAIPIRREEKYRALADQTADHLAEIREHPDDEKHTSERKER